MITGQSQISPDQVKDLSTPLLKKIYTSMLKIRLVEEKIAELVTDNQINCPCHLYIGQESVAAGVCEVLTDDDYVFSTHRSHGHYLAKGGDLNRMMAELFGKSTGCSGGYGGSMHLAAPEVGYPGSSAIVGGTIPLALGAALAATIENNRKVAVAFFGDGAATEGVLYESLNFAALEKLPVIFVCENNFYSTHMHITAIQSNIDIYKRAESFNVPAVKIDGNNVISVFQEARKAVENARSGRGPTFIECVTYRWRGHVGPNWDIEKGLRTRKEVDWWIDHCPIKRKGDFLISSEIMSAKEKEKIAEQLNDEIEKAVEFARESPFPEVRAYRNQVFN